jgi:hypothetical protein
MSKLVVVIEKQDGFNQKNAANSSNFCVSLDSKNAESLLADVMENLVKISGEEVVNIFGKNIRKSFENEVIAIPISKYKYH